MEDLFGPDFITLTDEDGNEFELEMVDSRSEERRVGKECRL